jgi:hypothetical protein
MEKQNDGIICPKLPSAKLLENYLQNGSDLDGTGKSARMGNSRMGNLPNHRI